MFKFTAPVAEDVGTMVDIQRLVELEGDQVPDRPLVDERSHFPVVTGVAQDKTEGQGQAAPGECIAHGEAIIKCGRQRLLAENMLAAHQCQQDLPRMMAVPRADEGPLRSGEGGRLLLACADFHVGSEFGGEGGDAQRIRVVDSRDLDPAVARFENPADHVTQTGSGSDGGDVHDLL